jgi:hypothetical protein
VKEIEREVELSPEKECKQKLSGGGNGERRSKGEVAMGIEGK